MPPTDPHAQAGLPSEGGAIQASGLSLDNRDVCTSQPPSAAARTLVSQRETTLACSETTGNLATLAAETSVAAATIEPPVLPKIPNYEVLGVLGHGGRGVVYKARQVLLKREVALKMILAGAHASPKDLARFQIEAEAVARLQHPNIVQVFEVGTCEGRPFLSLEYVAGGTLAQYLAGRPQPSRQAAELLRILAEAVHFAHQRGILHRDLKPANILLTPCADEPPAAALCPKIADFGMARLLDSESQATQRRATLTGDALGTPAYMAPEQASGVTRQFQPACDVYALGVILYEMLTGRPPLVGTDALNTLMRVLTEEPVPPRRIQPRVPRELETVCLKCLEKSAKQRYATAQELADDLGRFLRGEPIHARPARAWERATKWARRRPSQAALVAVAVMLPLLLFGGMLLHNRRLGSELANTRRERGRAEAELVLAQTAIDQLLEEVSPDRLPPTRANLELRRRLLDGALVFCRGLLSQNPDRPEVSWRAARAHRQVADIHQLVGQFRDANLHYGRAIELLMLAVRETPSDERYQAELASAYTNQGNLQKATGEFAQAEKSFELALAFFRKLVAADYRLQAVATQNNLGIVYLATGRGEQAEQAHRQAIGDCLRLVEVHPDRAECQRALATSYLNAGAACHAGDRLVEAEAAFNKALPLFAELHHRHPSRPDYRRSLASTQNNLAMVLARQERSEPAEAAFRQAAELFEELVVDYPAAPEYRQSLALSLFQHGRLAIQQEDFVQADRSLERAIELRQELVKESSESANAHCDLAVACQAAAELLRLRGNLKAAEGYLEQAIAAQRAAAELEQSEPVYRLLLRDQYVALADTLLEMGEPAKAARLAEEFPPLAPGDGRECRRAAALLVRCLTLAELVKAVDLPPEATAARAVELLRRSLENGASNAKDLLQSAEFERLRAREDFQKLVEPLSHGAGREVLR